MKACIQGTKYNCRQHPTQLDQMRAHSRQTNRFQRDYRYY